MTRFRISLVCPVLTGVLAGGLVMAQYKVDASGQGQKPFPWPEGKKCAVSLTFDDARQSQIDTGIPLLDRYQVKATFYISPDDFRKKLEGWKKAMAQGHEIGNHSMKHPCTGNYAFAREKALEEYSLEQIAKELDDASALIDSLLHVRPASFAYPCGQTYVGRGLETKSYVPLVAERFQSGRKWLNEGANDPWFCDMAQLLAMEADGKSFEQLLALVQKAREEGSWLILAGHEMQYSGNQATLLQALELLCRYIRDPETGVWIDTVGNIASYVLEQRKKKTE